MLGLLVAPGCHGGGWGQAGVWQTRGHPSFTEAFPETNLGTSEHQQGGRCS